MDVRKPNAVAHDADNVAEAISYIRIEDEDETAVPNIDLTGLDDEQEGVDTIRDITATEQQNTSGLPFGCILLPFAELNSEKVFPGDSLQFTDGVFLQDIRIFRDISTDQMIIDGNLLKRMRFMEGMLSRNRVNEVCLILKAPSTGKDAELSACRTIRQLADAVCKRKVIFTNKAFPAYSVYEYPYHPNGYLPEIREHAQLVCRWRFTEETINSGSKVVAGNLRTLSEDECDELAYEFAIRRLKAFLAKKKRIPRTHVEAAEADMQSFVDLAEGEDNDISPPIRSAKRSHAAMTQADPLDLTADSEDDVQISKRRVAETMKRFGATIEGTTKQQSTKEVLSTAKTATCSSRHRAARRQRVAAALKYTFGDLCTGAGGMASGAKQAGLKLNFLLDHWKVACDTLNLNFTNFHTKVLLKSIHDFCSNELDSENHDVSILHISFPCQPHSAVYTVEGRNHDDNIATGYSVSEILAKCKPRIVTFEQTSGIVTHRGGFHFRALIRQITDCGYSVRWKICNLAAYGNPQPRKRLIIIAACPGEALPTFPEPTHGPGKLPFVTIRDVLQGIRHIPVPPNLAHSLPRNELPYDSNQPLANCITCDGGLSNLHPTGKRTFTLFELAALQGFLPTHHFAGSKRDIMKQIGNAVPSNVGKILFRHIVKSLEESDRKIAAWKPKAVVPKHPEQTIDLIDDE